MLARRDLSEGEVRSKLLARDFEASEVEDAVARLRERRYLDDRTLALALARAQSRTKHQGPLKISAHLNKRQIPEELVREALRAEFPAGVEMERAAITLRRLARSAGARRAPAGAGEPGPDEGPAEEKDERKKENGRLFRRLVARGFSWEAARRALSDAGPSPRDGDGESDG